MSTQKKVGWSDIFTEEEIVQIKAMVKKAVEDAKKCEIVTIPKILIDRKARIDLIWELSRQQEIVRIKGELAELRVLHRDEIYAIKRRHADTNYKWWKNELDERHVARIKYYNERTNREQRLMELELGIRL